MVICDINLWILVNLLYNTVTESIYACNWICGCMWIESMDEMGTESMAEV